MLLVLLANPVCRLTAVQEESVRMWRSAKFSESEAEHILILKSNYQADMSLQSSENAEVASSGCCKGLVGHLPFIAQSSSASGLVI